MMQEAYDLFLTTLANMNRLKIIQVLRKKDCNVTEISRLTGLNQTTASHNLRRLLDCGFVSVRKEGWHRRYSLNKDTIKPLMTLIDRHISKHCARIIMKRLRGS